MSGIAEVLINQGYVVSGSDKAKTPVTDHLEQLGANIFFEHAPRNIENSQVVVVSSAIGLDNVEVVRAKESMIPVIPRAEMLAELMRMKYGIAIAGTHGKTTTTSLLAVCMHAAKLDPTIVIGGRLNALGGSARLGNYRLAFVHCSTRADIALLQCFEDRHQRLITSSLHFS